MQHRRIVISWIIMLVIVIGGVVGYADGQYEWYVDMSAAEGGNESSGASFQTVQIAVDAISDACESGEIEAAENKMIYVAPGIYSNSLRIRGADYNFILGQGCRLMNSSRTTLLV